MTAKDSVDLKDTSAWTRARYSRLGVACVVALTLFT